MTRRAYRRRGRWLAYGLASVVMGGWSVTYMVAVAHSWGPFAMQMVEAVGVAAVVALLVVLVWLDLRARRALDGPPDGTSPTPGGPERSSQQ